MPNARQAVGNVPDRLLHSQRIPALQEREAHVWLIDKLPISQSFFQLLSADERRRAACLRAGTPRNRFVSCRALLRMLLGSYLRTNAPTLRFGHNEFGKPHLMSQDDSCTIQFNVSHSGCAAAYAFAKTGRVGIDIEELRSFSNAQTIVREHLSGNEQWQYERLPDAVKFRAFYVGWTRKEALSKAVGLGLSLPLTSFDVSMDPCRPAALLDSRHPCFGNTHWYLYNLPVPSGFAGSLALDTPAVVLFANLHLTQGHGKDNAEVRWQVLRYQL